MNGNKKWFYLAKRNESDEETVWQLVEYIPIFLFILFSLILLITMCTDLFVYPNGYTSQINVYNYGAEVMEAVKAFEDAAKLQFAGGGMKLEEMRLVLDAFAPADSFNVTLVLLQVAAWLGLAVSLAAILPFVLPSLKDKVVVFGGKIGLPLGMVASLASSVFYLFDLILSFVLFAQVDSAAKVAGKMNQYGFVGDNTLSVVMLIFSLLFLALNVLSVILQMKWEEKKGKKN